MADAFKQGELFVYTNGDRWELGMVKRQNNSGDGYFCWYSRGDTAANTPTRCMHKLSNAGFTHIEQLLDAATVGEEHEMHICKRCGVAYELSIIDKGFGKHRFCPNCGYREMHQ